MAYPVRPMRKEDIPQVNEIDREAFPTQLPPPNYRHELQNQIARYIVVCDDTRTVEEPAAQTVRACPESHPGSSTTSTVTVLPAVNRRRHPGNYIVGFAGIWVLI